jgi:thiosulfate reductase cytochrome b subunit
MVLIFVWLHWRLGQKVGGDELTESMFW